MHVATLQLLTGEGNSSLCFSTRCTSSTLLAWVITAGQLASVRFQLNSFPVTSDAPAMASSTLAPSFPPPVMLSVRGFLNAVYNVAQTHDYAYMLGYQRKCALHRPCDVSCHCNFKLDDTQMSARSCPGGRSESIWCVEEPSCVFLALTPASFYSVD